MDDRFLSAALGYPTGLLTALLAMVLVYWLLALSGLVEFDADGLDLQDEVDAGELGGMAAILTGLGLGGVPPSVSISSVVLLAWTSCCLAAMWLLPEDVGLLTRLLTGAGLLLASLAFGVLLSACLLRPLRPLFRRHVAPANTDLVGQSCVVLTGSVDEKVGRAEVKQLGSALNVRVWAVSPNAFKRGSTARISEYDPTRGRYRIDA